MFRRALLKIFGRREAEILKLLREHFISVHETVNNLVSLISFLVEDSDTSGLSSILESKVEMVSIRESFADESYMKALINICEGALFSGLREDFIRLFESMDDIADFSKDASQIIWRNNFITPLRFFYRHRDASLSSFLNKVVDSVNFLGRAIDNIDVNIDDVVKNSIRVKELEEEADDVKWRLLKIIFSSKSSLDTLTLMELKDFILTLDGVADAAARSSEILITIVTKARA